MEKLPIDQAYANSQRTLTNEVERLTAERDALAAENHQLRNALTECREAGVAIQVHKGQVGGPWDSSYIITPDLEHFAALVRAQALEEAAGLCEAQENRVVARHPARIEFDPDSVMARKCAAAIRAAATGAG